MALSEQDLEQRLAILDHERDSLDDILRMIRGHVRDHKEHQEGFARVAFESLQRQVEAKYDLLLYRRAAIMDRLLSRRAP